MKKITGTKEWAACNINIQRGCSNACRYCYGMKNALRFKRIQTEEDWKIPVKDTDKILKLLRMRTTRKGIIMFPSTHDITEENVSDCFAVLAKLLGCGNHILVVSKPRYKIIQKLVETKTFQNFRSRIEFRFTITTLSEQTALYWEPGAPPIQERIRVLLYTLQHGFRCSVSCEPLLDPNCDIIYHLLKMTEDIPIWIGAMNYVKDAPKLNYVRIYHQFQNTYRIRWKESFRKHLPEELQLDITQKWWYTAPLPSIKGDDIP